MKKSVIVLAAASLGVLASCGDNTVTKNGEAFGLVHGAGYVGSATVKVENDKITAATLSEFCLPTYIVSDTATDDTVTAEVTSHNQTVTRHFYKEVKFSTYTLTFSAEKKTYLSGETEMVAFFQSEAAAKAYAEAVLANEVAVTISGQANKTILTNEKLNKDLNGYGGERFNWKSNRDATVAAFIRHGEKLLTATQKSGSEDRKWYVDDVDTGATWVDLASKKPNSLSYAQLLVNALRAAK